MYIAKYYQKNKLHESYNLWIRGSGLIILECFYLIYLDIYEEIHHYG